MTDGYEWHLRLNSIPSCRAFRKLWMRSTFWSRALFVRQKESERKGKTEVDDRNLPIYGAVIEIIQLLDARCAMRSKWKIMQWREGAHCSRCSELPQMDRIPFEAVLEWTWTLLSVRKLIPTTSSSDRFERKWRKLELEQVFEKIFIFDPFKSCAIGRFDFQAIAPTFLLMLCRVNIAELN